MKRYKKLGLLLAVLAFACTATFALSHYEQKKEEIQTSDAVVLSLPAGEVTALSWQEQNGSGLAFHKEGETWKYDEDAAFPVNQEKILNILSHFENFGVTFQISQVEDYDQYGLDAPQATIHLDTRDASYDFRLGDFSKMDQQRYVDLGDGNVYLVREDPLDIVEEDLSAMIQNDEIPQIQTITAIELSGSQEETIRYIPDSGLSYSEEDVYFTLDSLPLDTQKVDTLQNTIQSLDLSSYASYNATPQELEDCGLDTPELTIQLTYTPEEDTQEQALLLQIGRDPQALQAAAQAEDGEEVDIPAYIRIGDSQILYHLSDSAYQTLSASGYNDLRHKALFYADFSDVTQMDITLEGTTHTLLARQEEDGDATWHYPESPREADREEAADTPEVDISVLRQALYALDIETFTQEALTGKEELRMVLYLNNSAFPTTELTLYRLDGVNCQAELNGTPIGRLPRSQVVTLIESVQAIVLSSQ